MSKTSSDKAQLEALGGGRFKISGVLDAATVTHILSQGKERFQGLPRIEADFGAVTESDSAGLALLLEWLRLARKSGQQVHFGNVPEQIMALARISEVDDLLTQNGATAAPDAAGAAQPAGNVTA
ncbi:MAG TPA: STAS domain-containing protein [Povalibacter sp.]|nr:STAS domain-containing protein [Povalibacter sp.]